MADLVLSLFPGIGLLDSAFEEAGFCVVRGPDVLWGGDVRRFHPPAGVFAGVIGGPPCQAHSSFRRVNAAAGNSLAADLIPEFVRCLEAARPTWWLMENAPAVEALEVEGYVTHRQVFDNRWLGEAQERRRSIHFGTADGRPLRLTGAALDHPERETTCTASEGRAGRRKRVVGAERGAFAYHPRREWGRFCELQGLPADFLEESPLTNAGRYVAVGNGVPLPLGRAMAAAVRAAMDLA